MSTTTVAGARRAALAFIVTVLIDVLAFGLIIPVLPHLVEDFVGGDTAHAAYWVGVFGTVFALIQFVTAPIQGALSDRHGRRPVILLSCAGARAGLRVHGVGQSAAVAAGRADHLRRFGQRHHREPYVADVTAPDRRAKSYGMIGAAFGLGFIVGPLLGGWLGAIDLRLPF